MSDISSETASNNRLDPWGVKLPRPLRGIIPPMITPLSGRDALDHAGLDRLIEHMIDGGIHGLFILGTTGEGPSLSYRLRCELIDRTCTQVAGRIPVLVAVTDTSFVESVNLANHAADAGAAAAVFSAPYYFPRRPAGAARIRHPSRGTPAATRLPLQYAEPHEDHLRTRNADRGNPDSANRGTQGQFRRSDLFPGRSGDRQAAARFLGTAGP